MVYLHMLGEARVDVGENTLVPSAVRKFALVLYLSAERRRPVPRATLIDLILPGLPRVKANHSLRELVYQLRQAGAEFVTDPKGIQFASDSARSDLVDALEAATFTAEQLAAIDGGILPGYAPTLSEAFTEWLDDFRARAALELSAVLVPELRRARALGNWAATEPLARACLSIDSVNEDGTLAMAEGMALQGGKAKAVRFLDQYMELVGGDSSDLKLPAAVLRRRIGERLPQRYEGQSVLPFVGRDEEMVTLMERLDRARAGESGCVLLLGEAGIGKTRLATEFVSRAALAGVRFVTATAQPHDTRRPMGAFVDLVPQLLELPGALGCSPASMSALARLTKHDAGASDEAERSIGQSDEVAAGIARAISDLIDAITTETTVILWFEDAHWLDDMSLQTAATLVSGSDARPLLVLLTSRERRHVLSRCAQETTTLSVEPLAPSASRHLVHGALSEQTSGSDDSSHDWLVETSAGNPFFLVCLLNHVQRTGEYFAVPSTINEFLDQRIAGLSPDATSVLETCVLLGKYATIDRLVATIELPHFRLLAVLRELEERRMISRNTDLVKPSHWLLADSVQRNSSPIATVFAHRRIAALLKAESSYECSPGLLWDCGEHWVASGDSVRAIEVIRECAKHAVDIGRPREAAELLQRAAQIASSDLRTQSARESIRLANIVSERDVIIRGIDMLRAAGVPAVHDDIEVAELTAHASVGSNTDATIIRLRRCLDDPDSTLEHKQEVSVPLVVFCAQHQHDSLAHEAFSVLAPLVERAGSPPSFESLQFFLIYHANFGDQRESIRIARELLTRTDWPVSQQADALRYAGFALWRCGQAREALAALESAFSLAETCGLSRLQFVIASMSASFYSEIGDMRETQSWLARTERVADRVPVLRNTFEYLMIRTDIASGACDISELRALYDAGQRLGGSWPNESVQRWADTLRILLEHLSGEPLDSAAAIGHLTRFHRDGNSGDSADFEMATALRISRVSESLDITRSRLKQYIEKGRRTNLPLSPMLRHVADDIDATCLPTTAH